MSIHNNLDKDGYADLHSALHWVQKYIHLVSTAPALHLMHLH